MNKNRNRMVENPYKSGDLKPYGFLDNDERKAEMLSIETIAFSCQEWSEDPHYANDTKHEELCRMIELFKENQISKSALHDLLSIGMNKKCMYTENEEEIKDFANMVFGEHGYSRFLIINNRKKEIDIDILQEVKDSFLSTEDAYTEMLINDNIYFDTMTPWKALDIMNDITVNYFDCNETLEEIKVRMHKNAAKECSGLDTVYQSKFDLGILTIAEKIAVDIDEETAKKFIKNCDIYSGSIDEARENISKAYREYQEEYCL